MERLDSVAPWLVESLRKSTTSKLRQAIIVALEFAIERSSFSDPLLSDAIECLRDGRLNEDLRAQLLDLEVQQDEEYFAREADAKNGLIDEQDYLSAFAKARAVAAVAAGLNADLLRAALESIYEAAAVADDPSALFDEISEVLQ